MSEFSGSSFLQTYSRMCRTTSGKQKRENSRGINSVWELHPPCHAVVNFPACNDSCLDACARATDSLKHLQSSRQCRAQCVHACTVLQRQSGKSFDSCFIHSGGEKKTRTKGVLSGDGTVAEYNRNI